MSVNSNALIPPGTDVVCSSCNVVLFHSPDDTAVPAGITVKACMEYYTELLLSSFVNNDQILRVNKLTMLVLTKYESQRAHLLSEITQEIHIG